MLTAHAKPSIWDGMTDIPHPEAMIEFVKNDLARLLGEGYHDEVREIYDWLASRLNQSDKGYTTIKYLAHGQPVPKGWELADTLQGTPHGHHAVLIVKEKEDGGQNS